MDAEKQSSTLCPRCRNAEMDALERLIDAVLAYLFRPTQAQQIISSAAATWSAALGTPQKSWYHRHREDYERTGYTIELDRMMRHIEEEGPG